jgi:hypothetical protein
MAAREGIEGVIERRASMTLAEQEQRRAKPFVLAFDVHICAIGTGCDEAKASSVELEQEGASVVADGLFARLENLRDDSVATVQLDLHLETGLRSFTLLPASSVLALHHVAEACAEMRIETQYLSDSLRARS